jgi:biotin-dependent carboxylase-like uncharacterized protein
MITIIRPALQTTVQDLGRRGTRHLGVSQGGAVDRLALVLANTLVGNPDEAAALELCLPPAALQFNADCVIAVTGADCAARLDGTPLPIAQPRQARSGMTLDLSRPTRGVRVYLCVRGGIDVPLLLGSRSTDLQTQSGGFGGRMMRRGDVLRVCAIESSPSSATRALSTDAAPPSSLCWPPADAPIRIMPGPEFDEFAPSSRAALVESAWKVSAQGNRTGLRLTGPTLARLEPHEMKSHAVFPGVIQVPDEGAPIVLMADAHTTGGYPRMATVMAADQWRLAQVAPGESLRFSLCTRADAMKAWQQQQADLQDFKRTLHAH